MKALGKWWQGIYVTCKHCGGLFKLDETDRPKDLDENRATVNCPDCKALIVFVKRAGASDASKTGWRGN